MSESPENTQLNKLLELLPELIAQVEYSELYGYDLLKLADTETGIVIRDRLLTKFLVANKFVLNDAADQLKKTLTWRKDFNPLSAGFLENHDETLHKLSVITSVPLPKVHKEEAQEEEAKSVHSADAAAPPAAVAAAEETSEPKELPAVPQVVAEPTPEVEGNLIMTWNFYSDTKKSEELSDFDTFIRWRVGAMERGIALLDFAHLETSYMAQMHDYNNLSLLRLDSVTKAATKATIHLFQSYYPEILNVQYVVNVSTVMQWAFNFVKRFIAKKTLEKFSVISNGSDLARTTGEWVPVKYGGVTESIEEIQVNEISPINPELVVLYVPKPVEEKKEVSEEVTNEKTEEGAVPAEKVDAIPASNADMPPETHVDVAPTAIALETPKAGATAAAF